MNTVEIGNKFEEQIFDLFANDIESDRFWAKKECCRIFRQKAYASRDRGSDIIFDVAIEIRYPGVAELSALVLIECKNYKNKVKPEQVEAFFAKVQQVYGANTKAIVATTSSFQSGAFNYAQSKGMGLLRYIAPDHQKWELRRSQSASASDSTSETAEIARQALEHEEFSPETFDLFMGSPASTTVSLYEFFDQLCLHESGDQYPAYRNPRQRVMDIVPYIEKGTLEDEASKVLAVCQYAGGDVSLEAICQIEKRNSGLMVEYVDTELPTSTLGKIVFDESKIVIYRSQTERHFGRERFTLAHELAHYFLRHGRYLKNEACDDSDFDLRSAAKLAARDIRRLEFQANYFAAAMLMPKSSFIGHLRGALAELGIHDRGFGALYLDDQDCNRQAFKLVTTYLSQKFSVSKEATAIRMNGLNLLVDVRKHL
jgi:IrrE N-terminal-like domain/Restriction endonuclease